MICSVELTPRCCKSLKKVPNTTVVDKLGRPDVYSGSTSPKLGDAAASTTRQFGTAIGEVLAKGSRSGIFELPGG
jgi:hypothetical protein